MEMESGVILYFKKKRRAYVARTDKGKVFLPISARQMLDGAAMRKLQAGEGRLKPKETDKVFVAEVELVDSILSAKAWALA